MTKDELRAMPLDTVEQVSRFRMAAFDCITELEARLQANTTEIAQLVNAPLIETPYHDDLTLWVANLVEELKVLLEAQIAAKGKQEWISETKLERINMAINTAVNIVNMSDDDHIQTMGAHIADQLISILPTPPGAE